MMFVGNPKFNKISKIYPLQAAKDDEEITSLQAQLREFYDENLRLKEALESNRRAVDRIQQEYRECQEKVFLGCTI